MSKININRNIFLEKEELQRLQQFLGPDSLPYQTLLDNTISWGILRTVFTGTSPDFLVEVGSNVGTIKINYLSRAVDKDRLLIKQQPIDNISVPNDGVFYWVKISHKYTNLEVGTCSVNINGEVTGVGTLFTEVLRGQSSEVPTKIMFYKDGLINNQIYEVVDVLDNLNIIINGVDFSEESGLKYIVVGSTPLGEVITDEQKEGLYLYDSCNIELIPEEVLDTEPVINYVEEKQFYISRVVNNAGVITVEDKRSNFLTFNIEGMSSKMDKDKNLSDLEDKAAARRELNVMTPIEIEQAYFNDSGWQTMTRGSTVSSTGFSMKARRLGRMVTITGIVQTGSAAVNDIVAYLPWSSIGIYAKPTTRIYIEGHEVSGNENNRGMRMYIDPPAALETNMNIKVLTVHNDTTVSFTITYIGG